MLLSLVELLIDIERDVQHLLLLSSPSNPSSPRAVMRQNWLGKRVGRGSAAEPRRISQWARRRSAPPSYYDSIFTAGCVALAMASSGVDDGNAQVAVLLVALLIDRVRCFSESLPTTSLGCVGVDWGHTYDAAAGRIAH
jgi:hypothetical protein